MQLKVLLVLAVMASLEVAALRTSMLSSVTLCLQMTGINLLQLASRGWMQTTEVFEFRTPEIIPTQPDAYLCYPFVIPKDETWYITAIGPILVYPEAIHHIIAVTCPSLSSDSAVWNCVGARDNAFPRMEFCKESVDNLLYDWTPEVSEYHFPTDVGYMVGGGGDKQNLILQVHYNDVSQFNDSFRDSSGLKITFTQERTPYIAEMMTTQADGFLLPNSVESLQSLCVMRIPDDTTLHVFSYLVHTHELGLLVTGYRVRDGHLTEIGQRSPQLPKDFVPTNVTLRDGDTVIVHCIMYNGRHHVVYTGEAHHDEMCMLRLLYFAEDGDRAPAFTCQPTTTTNPQH